MISQMSRSSWQWSLQLMDAPRAWRHTEGDPEVVVAVLDTGVDARHPDLAGKVLQGVNLCEPGRDSTDDDGHGTCVAGIIAGHEGTRPRFRGVAPQCKILPIKVNEPRSGNVVAASIALGIREALARGAHVLNLSVGCEVGEPGFTHDTMAALANAIYDALRMGVPVVCAAGPRHAKTYPAAWETLPEFAGLISVGACDRDGSPTVWSPRWEYVSLLAPAGATTTWRPNGRTMHGPFGGTSASSPHVAGTLALLRTLRPDLSPVELKRVLLSHARRIHGGRWLCLDAGSAVEAVARPRKWRGIQPPMPGENDRARLQFLQRPQ